MLGSFLGAIRGRSELRIDGEGMHVHWGRRSQQLKSRGQGMSQHQRLQLRLSANNGMNGMAVFASSALAW